MVEKKKLQHPRNVQALIGWYRRHKTPNDVAQVEHLFDPPPGPPSALQLACEALALQGFEAGREFQAANPDFALTPGCYLDAVPRRGVDDVVEDLSQRFQSTVDIVTLESGLSLEQAADVADQVAAALRERGSQMRHEAAHE